MAAQGLRDMGDGHESVANPAEAEELRTRGKRLQLYSAIGASLATLLAALAASL